MTMNSLSLMLKFHLLPWLIKRLKQESSEFKACLSQREFKVSLGNLVRLCLKERAQGWEHKPSKNVYSPNVPSIPDVTKPSALWPVRLRVEKQMRL